MSDVETQSKIFDPICVKANAYHASGLPLVHLNQIASIQQGIHLPPHQEQGNVTHYLINLSDVSDDEICLNTLTQVSYDNPEKLEKYKVLSGDLILASRGT